jgi:hypothetical protein
MKHFATFFLLCLGFFGCSASLADEPSDDDAYQTSVGSDGVQHASILGGNYFIRPKLVIVKVNVPLELEVILV